LRPIAWLTVGVIGFGVWGAAPAAEASPATLKRSVENIVLAPLDVVLSPAVAGKTLYTGLRDIDDSPAVRIAYPAPGFVWLTAVQAGAGVIRLVTGVFEFVPGLILLPFDADMDPLFDPADENDAIVNFETPVFDFRFGIDYTTSSY
jgi:hypothetical protein